MRVQPASTIRSPKPPRTRTLWACVLAGFVAAALAPVAGQQQPSNPAQPLQSPAAAAPSDPGARQSEPQTSGAASAGQKKHTVVETENLVKMAEELKAEVDKTTQNTLSLPVIRKAAEIERTAHAVREKAKLVEVANGGGAS